MPLPTYRPGASPLHTTVRGGPTRPRALGFVGLAAALLALAVGLAAAVTVTVPDDFPTIQQAIDSGANEVLVRPGVYPETLAIHREVDVKGLVRYGTSPDSLPVVAGLVFTDFYGEQVHNKDIRVWSLRFLSPVQNRFTWSPFWNPLAIEIAGCALDQGLWDRDNVASGQIEYYLRRCLINGPMRALSPQRVWLEDCTVRGPIDLPRGCENVTVARCDFKGPGPFAIHIRDGECEIFLNTFEGFETPIIHRSGWRVAAFSNSFVGPGTVPVLLPDDGSELSFHRNRVIGFQYGILVAAEWGDLYATGNVIEQCGTGIRSETRYARIDGNTVRNCGSGVTLRAHEGLRATGNIVRSCQGDGMVLDAGYATVDTNVVGRCTGAGFRLKTSLAFANDSKFSSNTSYGNGGSGVVIDTPDPYGRWYVERNIAFENGGHGLEFSGAGSIQLGCNDWFGTVAGAVSGAEPGGTDLALDPMFCDATQDDVHLSALSPLLNAVGCGQIGALGLGCDVPIVSRLTSFTAIPTTVGIEVRWQVADAAPGFAAWPERSEQLGGPWSPAEYERGSEGDVTVDLDRNVEPARRYWYRLMATDRGATRVLGSPIEVTTAAPSRFHLASTGPNPTAGALEAEFLVAHTADISLELFDPLGRRVATLASGSWPAGNHRARWSGTGGAAAGVYLMRYRYPGGENRRRVVILK